MTCVIVNHVALHMDAIPTLKRTDMSTSNCSKIHAQLAVMLVTQGEYVIASSQP